MSTAFAPVADEERRAALRPVVLGAVAWSSMGLSTSGRAELSWVAVAMVLGFALLAWRRHSAWWTACALLACVCVATGGARAWAIDQGPLAALARERATATVEVRVSGGGRSFEATGRRDALWVGRAELRAVEARGEAWSSAVPVTVFASGEEARAWEQLPLGATVRVSARLQAPEAGSGMAAEVRARGRPEVREPPDAVASVVGGIRSGLVRACSGLSPDARALVPALVVGDTSGMTDDLRERFVTTGLTHLTAVSGANLTLLLGFLRAVATGAGVRGRALWGLQVGGVCGFVALCLGEPSVVRAAAMGLVGLAALGRAGRGRQGLRFLGAAVVAVVLVDPAMSRSLGFALSVLATFGLLRWAAAWTDRLARWLPRWLAEALAVPLAAQVATEPIVVGLAGQVSVVSVLANVVSGPLVGPATVLGLVAALAAPVAPPVAIGAAWLAGWCAQAIAWVARLGDALPGAAVPWQVGPYGVAVVVWGCLVAIVLMPHLLGRPWVACGVALLVVLSLVRTPTPPGWPPSGWAVAVCDVGQGDAILVNAGAGQAVLVDTGPDPRALDRCLDQLGIARLPLVVLTHLHADHVGGLSALARRDVGVVVTSAVGSPRAASARVDQGFPGRRQVVEGPRAWRVGDAHVEVLCAPAAVPAPSGVPGQVPDARPDPARDPSSSPPGAGESDSAAENDQSLLVRLTSGGVSVLVAGDAEETTQAAHRSLGKALDVDVLVVPHHGSGHHDPAFIAQARPDVALVSVGADNGYGHPSARTLRSVAATGARLARTDLNGALAVGRRDDRLWLAHQR